MRLVRIILGLLLLVIGSILGDGYKHNLYLLWLSSSAFLIIYSEFITTSLLNTKDDLEIYKGKVSTLTILKENGGNTVQMSIFPTDRVIVDREVKMDLFVTFAIPITEIPDVKLRTDNDWEVTIYTRQQLNKKYAGNYEYILNNPLVNKIDDRFLKYSFYIKAKEAGVHKFSIEVSNGSMNGEIKNSIFVHQA